MNGGDLILQTKLIPPQIKGKVLRRERLLNLLKENLDKKVILICADAGYGKTTLLAQFCTEFDKSLMFYDLDSSDNDLTTFFNYITTGIQRLYPNFGQRTKGVIGQTRNVEILVGTFINEFVEKIKEKFCIILDDYHHLQQNKEIANALDYLLRYLPVNLHFIISARSVLPLNLTYYFAKQDLFKLERRQLQFNLKETQLLLSEVYGLNIPDAEIVRIEKHSEGWITAIQLILQKISASGEDKAKETLNGYITSDEEVFSYFAREVFENQPKEIREFLIKTSTLQWMNIDICNYLLEIKDANKILTYLEDEHIFVSRFDNKYKYHRLFKDFLSRNIIELYGEKMLKSLYRKTGTWCEQNKNFIYAIEYYVAGELFDKAAKLLENFSWDLIKQGEMNMLFHLIDSLPGQIFNVHPLLMIQKSKALRFLTNFNEALKFSENALRLYRKKKNKDGIAEALSEMSIIYLETGQLGKALTFGKKALRYFSLRFFPKKVKVLNVIGSVYQNLSDYRQAKRNLLLALKICNKIGDKFYEYLVKINLGLAYYKEGELQKGVEILEDITRELDYGSASYPVLLNLYINLGNIHIEMGRYDNAKNTLEKAEEIAKKFNDQRALAYVYDIKSELYMRGNNFHQALSYIEKVSTINENLNDSGLVLGINLRKANIYLIQNNLSHAWACIENVKKFIKQNIPFFITNHIEVLITEGRFKYAAHQRAAAEKLFKQAASLANKIKSRYLYFRVIFELAGLQLEKKAYVKASDLLRKALSLSKKMGYDFCLLKEVERDLSLFKFALENRIMSNYVKQILIKSENNGVHTLLKEIDFKQARPEIDCSFEVDLLGEFNLRKNNAPIKIRLYKKTKTLLCYLLLNQGRRITAGELVELFWPEWESPRGLSNLHTHITYLRRLFKNIAEELIVYKGETYQINPIINYKIDVCEFEELTKKAQNLENKNLNESMKYYLRAVEIYKGDLLPTIYAEWCEEKRIYYRELYRESLKKIIGCYIKKKKFRDGLVIGKKLLKLDKYDESAHCLVMQCLAGSGRREELTRHYEKLKATFEKEIGTPLSKKTILAYQCLAKS